MTNDYYNATLVISRQSRARSDEVNARFSAIAAAFDKLPPRDALWRGQINYAPAGGTANALTLTLPDTAFAYNTGQVVRMQVAETNTGTVTVDINGSGVRAVHRPDGSPLTPGDLQAGDVVDLIYDGSVFRLGQGSGGYLTRLSSETTTSAANAATSEANAAASEAAAATSEANAATSESIAVTSANAASTSAGNAATSETNAEAAETTAVNAASAAATSASEASTSASNAATSESNAAASAASASSDATDLNSAKTAAEAARDLAQQWASEDEDVVVTSGKYSALHWAAKAEESVAVAVRTEGQATLIGGFDAEEEDYGNVNSGTITPEVTGPNQSSFKRLINEGPFTLTKPAVSKSCTIRIHIINGANAGLISTSGFDRTLDPDRYDIVPNKEYFFYIDHTPTRTILTVREIV